MKHKLKGEVVGESDSITRSAALIYDEAIKDADGGTMVAVVLYSSAGNIIFWMRPDYDPMEIMIWGEKYLGQTFDANRFKEFYVTRQPPAEWEAASRPRHAARTGKG